MKSMAKNLSKLDLKLKLSNPTRMRQWACKWTKIKKIFCFGIIVGFLALPKSGRNKLLIQTSKLIIYLESTVFLGKIFRELPVISKSKSVILKKKSVISKRKSVILKKKSVISKKKIGCWGTPTFSKSQIVPRFFKNVRKLLQDCSVRFSAISQLPKTVCCQFVQKLGRYFPK